MHDPLLGVKFFREYKAELKKALTHETEAKGGLFEEKTIGRKSHDTVP
jgi:hypothetical protein